MGAVLRAQIPELKVECHSCEGNGGSFELGEVAAVIRVMRVRRSASLCCLSNPLSFPMTMTPCRR